MDEYRDYMKGTLKDHGLRYWEPSCLKHAFYKIATLSHSESEIILVLITYQ